MYQSADSYRWGKPNNSSHACPGLQSGTEAAHHRLVVQASRHTTTGASSRPPSPYSFPSSRLLCLCPAQSVFSGLTFRSEFGSETFSMFKESSYRELPGSSCGLRSGPGSLQPPEGLDRPSEEHPRSELQNQKVYDPS